MCISLVSGRIWEIGRSAKDWVAEQVANNLLINRLYPSSYDESSSSDSSDGEEEKEESISEKHVDDDLKEVVVTSDEQRSLADVPSISNTLNIRRSSHGSTSTAVKGNPNKQLNDMIGYLRQRISYFRESTQEREEVKAPPTPSIQSFLTLQHWNSPGNSND